MNRIIRSEQALSINGVEGRAFNVIMNEDGKILNQRWVSDKRHWIENSYRMSMRVEIRFDDQCRNGHETFAITATGWRNGREDFGGVCDDEIEKHFPELAPLIKWHLCSSDGPLHYIANTVYLAGDRDHYGRKAGDVSATISAVKFGDNPIRHRLPKAFVKFIRGGADHGFNFSVVPLNHETEINKFAPKWTFSGFGSRWYQGPFDTKEEADDFLIALKTCNPSFVEIVTERSVGKPRELDAARHAAIWPDATDEELSQDAKALQAALTERLPKLLDEFCHAIESAGLIWPDVKK